MPYKLRSKLTYANVMATVALFVALGGGAYAATKLPANSVGSKQIRKKAVTPAKVARATVKLFRGQRGGRGLKGDRGRPGAPGSDAPGVMLTRVEAPFNADTTFFFGAVGAAGTRGTDESLVALVIPAGATVSARALTVKMMDPLPAGAAIEYTLRVNRADTPVTCTITAPATTCNSGSATQTIAPGSEVAFKERSGTAAPGYHNAAVGWRLTRP